MSKKILIVDDSVAMRQMVKFTLNSAGYNVTEATDGMAGLQTAKLQAFDLVITDLNMPNMSGLEMTAQLRTLLGYKTTPLLLLTTEYSDAKKAQGRGAKGGDISAAIEQKIPFRQVITMVCEQAASMPVLNLRRKKGESLLILNGEQINWLLDGYDIAAMTPHSL